MIRLELFILLGFVIGVAAALLFQWAWRSISSIRERRILTRARLEALKVRIDNAPTEQLLEEISTRDDLAHPSVKWDPRMTEWKCSVPRSVIEDEDGNIQAAESQSVFKKGK